MRSIVQEWCFRVVATSSETLSNQEALSSLLKKVTLWSMTVMYTTTETTLHLEDTQVFVENHQAEKGCANEQIFDCPNEGDGLHRKKENQQQSLQLYPYECVKC